MYIRESVPLHLFPWTVYKSVLLKTAVISHTQIAAKFQHFANRAARLLFGIAICAAGISSDPVDKHRFSALTIKISAVMAQFRKSSVSPIKMHTWRKEEEKEVCLVVLIRNIQFVVQKMWSQKRRVQIFLLCVGNSLLWLLWLKNMLLCCGPIIHGVAGLHFGPIELSI